MKTTCMERKEKASMVSGRNKTNKPKNTSEGENKYTVKSSMWFHTSMLPHFLLLIGPSFYTIIEFGSNQ